MTVPRWLKLRQYIDKRLFVRLILRGDFDFIFPVFSELFCCFTLDAGVFPDLWLYAHSWFIMDRIYDIIRVIRRSIFCFCALPWAIVFDASYKAGCTLLNAIGSILLGVYIEKWWREVSKAVITNVRGPVAYASTMFSSRCIVFAEMLVTRIRNGCNGRTLITPWAPNNIWRVPLKILDSPVFKLESVVVTRL